MGSAGNAVQQLLACETQQRRMDAFVVKGLSFRHLKTLGHNSQTPIEDEALVEACHTNNIKLCQVYLGSGCQFIVRGVSTGSYLPCKTVGPDGDEDESFYGSQAERLVKVVWILTHDYRSGDAPMSDLSLIHI